MNTPRSKKTNVPAKTSLLTSSLALAAVALLAVVVAPSISAQFIYVANTNDNTVSKIDINQEKEVARYATWYPPGSNQWPAPSRIVRDRLDYVYVLNRFFPVPANAANPPFPALLKIAPTGGVAGTPGTLGVTTSSGAGTGAVMPMTEVTTNNEIDGGDTKDARILWGKPIGNPGDEGAIGRSLCMDRSGFLWVGMWDREKYYKVDPTTGIPVGAAVSTPRHKPYGCQVDTQGRLWSVNGANTLAEIDTVTHTLTKIRDHRSPPSKDYGRNYAVSLFNGCGSEQTKVYLSEWATWGPGLPGKTYIVYDPQTDTFSNPPTAAPPVPLFTAITVAVDKNGDILSGQYTPANAGGGRIVKSTPAGVLVWDTTTTPGAGPTVFTSDLRGIIIDDNNDVWAVDRDGDQVVKYRSSDGKQMAIVGVGDSPYTYGNPPPPSCPCAKILEQKITCQKQKDGTATYSWTFTFTNKSPFSMPVTAITIGSSQVTSLTPAQVGFNPAVPPNGQATVSGTFDVTNPVPGSVVCLDITLSFGEGTGWCCPTERVCFVLPECPTCAILEGQFKCKQGQKVLDLSVTNLGPTAAQGAQIISNTPGVAVSPQSTTLAFPQNTPVVVPLTVTGAAPGQVISLSVMLHGPIDPKAGVYSWCCTATVKVTYPIKHCLWWWDGEIFDDLNLNGLRDSGEDGLGGWTVTLTDAKGAPRTTTSNDSGAYHFEEIEPALLRVSVQPPKGWRGTTPKGAGYSLSVEEPPKGKLNFGFTKARP